MITITKELDEIEKIIEHGKLKEATKRIEEVLQKEDISKEEEVRSKLLLAWIHFWLSYFNWQIQNIPDEKHALKSFDLSEEVIKEGSKLKLFSYVFDAHILQIPGFFFRQEHELGEIVYKNLEKMWEEKKDLMEDKEPHFLLIQAFKSSIKSFAGEKVPEDYLKTTIDILEKAKKMYEGRKESFFFQFAYLTTKSGVYMRTGETNKLEDLVEEMLTLAEEYDNKYMIAHVYGYKASGKDTLEYIMKRMQIWEELEFEGREAGHNMRMGAYYVLHQKDFDKALECFKISLKYYQEIKSEIAIAKASENIGYTYLAKGDLNTALEYSEKAYKVLNEKKPEYWWNILPDLASIYLMKGDIDKALEIQEQRLAFHENAQFTRHIAFTLIDISKILWQKGLSEQAIEKAKKSLELFRKMDNKLWLVDVLSNLIYYLTEIDETEEAKKYLEELEQIYKETKDKNSKRILDFSQALVLRKSEESKDVLKAEFLLEKLLEEELEYSFYILIVLVLAEILLKELRFSGDREYLIKLQKHVVDLYSLSTVNNSYSLTVQTLLLQSKIALIELEAEKAKKLLNQALKIAEDKGLDKLKSEINQEIEMFKAEAKQIESFDKETSISKRMGAISLEKRVNGIKKTSVTEVHVEETEISKKLFSLSI
jgi:tetratricopeptide (TPR) repeat protein